MNINSKIWKLEYKKLDLDNKKEVEEFKKLKLKSLIEDNWVNNFLMTPKEYMETIKMPQKKIYILLKLKNKIIWFIFFKRLKYTKANHNFEISDIYIDSNYQWNWLGHILLETTEKSILKENKKLWLINIWLRVAENNKKWILLYKKKWYKKIWIQKNYINDNWSYKWLVYMQKEIKNEYL